MAIELPLDLIEEILLRFPAQSLAPWRYVCKQWKTLITDSRFVKRHLSYHRGHEQQFTIYNNFTDTTVSCISSCQVSSYTLSSLGIDYDELNNVPSLKLKVLKSWDSSVYHMSHCDGLLLFVMSNYKLLVCNPLLKEARWIKSSDATSHGYMDVFGLGYKSSSCNDYYKIVEFSCGISTRYEKDLRVHIYDFKSDCWKTVVDSTYDNRFLQVPCSSVCLRGTPYWLCWKSDNEMIRSFDFSEERFKPLVPPPKETAYYLSYLGVYERDHLSMLRRYYETDTIHIWVRKNNLWNMLMKVDDTPQIVTGHSPLSYSIAKDDKLVICFRDKWDGTVTIYIVGENQKHQKLEHSFGVDRISGDGDCYYVPSLLQVPRPLKRRRKKKRINKLHS